MCASAKMFLWHSWCLKRSDFITSPRIITDFFEKKILTHQTFHGTNRCALGLRRTCSFGGRLSLNSREYKFRFFFPDRTDEWDYEDFIMCWFSPNVSPRAPVSCQRRVCVVIQTIPSNSALCSPAPLFQMILPLLLLLASLPQQYGSEAESSHVSKFNPPGVKEQNGEFSVL